MHRKCILKGDIKFSSRLESFNVEANNPVFIENPEGYHTEVAFPPKVLKIFFRNYNRCDTQGSSGVLYLRKAPLYKSPWRLKIHINMVTALSHPEK